MAIKTSRIMKAGKPQRTYRGEAEARFLLNLLNREGMMRQESLPGIILALQELGDCRSMSRNRLWREQSPKIQAMDKILRQFQARPLLRLLSPPLGDGFRLEWQRIEGDDLELQAVLRAVRLTQEGQIASLKKCANPDCKLWLFARFGHQRFCSESCKENFHQSNEADKKRRREWARENYKTRKILDSGSKVAATFKRKKNAK